MSKNINNQAQQITSKKVRAPITESKVETKAPAKKVQTVKPKLRTQPKTPTTHIELMQSAGIEPEDYGAANYIISHESSWRVDATEPHTGAHGLVQALPYSKTGCGWSDGLCQLKWANKYAVERYGGWRTAYAHWVNFHWW